MRGTYRAGIWVCAVLIIVPTVQFPLTGGWNVGTTARAGGATQLTFCVARPARGQIALVWQRGQTLPLVRLRVSGLAHDDLFGLFVDQGRSRLAYDIIAGVRSDRAGVLARDVRALRPPEGAPRRLLLESWHGHDVIGALAYPCLSERHTKTSP